MTGRRVAIAPARAKRPGAARATFDPPTSAELDECPFCAGREDRTPPHTLVLPNDEWRVRVVPNLYPAFGRQEVVVHTPQHLRSIADLDGGQLELVADAWRHRRNAVQEGYLHALINEGREAGASLPHTHSQLVWLPDAPPETQYGVDRETWHIVTGQRGLVLACPHVSRAPYECVVAPASPERGAFGEQLGPALRLLAEAIRRVRAASGAVPLNAWLHDSSDWHIELMPRLGILAGVELGAGWWINPLAPEEAAAALQES